MIFIIKGFQTIVFIFIVIVISTTFGRYILQSSSGVSRTLKPTWNFELHPLLNPQVSPVLILLAITGYKH